MKSLFLTLLLALPSHAQLIVAFSGGNPLTVGPGTAGFAFVDTTPMTLRSLGVWDESGAGLSDSHRVGLWDAATQVLLGSVVVNPASATDLGGFWYAALSAPITLAVGHSYVLAAQYADISFDLVRGNVPTVTTSGITLGSPVLSSGIGFDYPDVPLDAAMFGFLGPNATTTAVPEPWSWSLISAGLLVAFAVYRRSGCRLAFLVALACASISLHASDPTIVLARTPTLELSAVAARLANGHPEIRPLLRSWVADNRPAALLSVQRALDALAEPGNRPPFTPGNVNGNRPVIPPGLRNYATP